MAVAIPRARLHPRLHPYSCLFVLLGAALFRVFRGKRPFSLWTCLSHNAGVVGSSPTPAIDEPIT